MKPESYTLLVYNQIPDYLDFYLIPNKEITGHQLILLIEAHDKLVNSDDVNSGMEFLMAALCEKEENCNPDVPKEWHCVWNKYKVTNPLHLSSLTGTISRVIKSGFIL